MVKNNFMDAMMEGTKEMSRMTKYKGIIFDLDGTLLDTIEDISDSVNEVLKIYNYPTHDYKDYKLKVGNGFKNLIENSFPEGIDEKVILKGLELFIEIYDRNYMNKTHPYEGIPEVLDGLTKMGIKLGINSNKRNDYTNQLVEKFFPDIPFVKVYGERKEIPKKPNPTTALEIAYLMELKPQEVLYIGDSKTDILTAGNAGMDSVGVLWGFRSYEELKEYNASYIVKFPHNILEIVCNS